MFWLRNKKINFWYALLTKGLHNLSQETWQMLMYKKNVLNCLCYYCINSQFFFFLLPQSSKSQPLPQVLKLSYQFLSICLCIDSSKSISLRVLGFEVLYSMKIVKCAVLLNGEETEEKLVMFPVSQTEQMNLQSGTEVIVYPPWYVYCRFGNFREGFTVIHLQFWAYGSWDSLFPISMSPTANL